MHRTMTKSDPADRTQDPAATAVINDLLLQSFVDGPGNRAVVFLQGCNFNCLTCHNPYTIQLCNHCGHCVPVCPTGALSKVGEGVRWDAKQCVGCDACLGACPRDSSPKTRVLTVEALWQEIEPAGAFLSGVSVSGGEPTLQTPYLVSLFQRVKAESELDTLIETNGSASIEDLERLCAVTDMFMVDLKAVDESVHRRLTGRGNEDVLNSIRFLSRSGKLHQVRQVIVPGVNDRTEDADKLAQTLRRIDPAVSLRLLRFRPQGTRGEAAGWPSPSDEVMDDLVAAARSAGIPDTDRSI